MHRTRIVSAVVTSALALSLTGSAHGSGPCTDQGRACVVSAAQSYLDALVSHDASQVRFAPTVVRTENGIDTGDGAADLRSQLTTGPQYGVILGLRGIRWVVDRDQAVATYLIDTGSAPGVPGSTSTVHVMERFRVARGLITEIEAVFCFAGGLTPEAARAHSASPVTNSLCLRSGPVGI